MKEQKNGILYGATGGLAVKIAGLAAAFFSSVVLARLLHLELYGAYAYAVTWANVLSVFGVFGADIIVIRQLARHVADSNQNIINSLFWEGLYVTLFASVILASFIAVVCACFPFLLDYETKNALWFVPILVPVLSSIRYCQSAAQGLGMTTVSQLPFFVAIPLISSFLVSILIITPMDPSRVGMSSYLGASLIALIMAVGLLRGYIRMPTKQKAFTPVLIWRHYGAVVGTNGIMMAAEHTPMLIVGAYLGPSAAALYDIAKRFANLVAMPILAVNLSMSPAVARHFGRMEWKLLEKVVGRLTTFAFILSVTFAAGLLVIGKPLLGFYGNSFENGYLILLTLSAGQVIYVALGSVVLLLNMTEHEGKAVAGVIIYAGLLLASISIALFLNGSLLSVALGTVGAMVLWKGWMGLVVRHTVGIRPWINIDGMRGFWKEVYDVWAKKNA